ncbi:MAG: hypothetical protein AB7F99_13875 [Vicinamibacterales bacterium]
MLHSLPSVDRALKHPAVLCAAAVLLVCIAYSNSLSGPFTFDDRTEVVENPSIQNLRDWRGVLRYNLTRPVVNVSYAVDYSVWGGRRVFGFHLTNLLLHALNVALLFALVRRLIRDGTRPGPSGEDADVTAFLVASLFAVHPMMTEAVSYISGRSDLLVTTWFLAALYSFFRFFVLGAGRWAAAGLLCFFLALGTKETAAAFPFVLVALDYLLGPEDGRRRRLWQLHLPLVAIVIAAGLAKVWLYMAIENAAAPRAPLMNAVLAAEVAVRYMGLLLFPFGQTIVHDVALVSSLAEWRVLAAVNVLLTCAIVAVSLRRRAPIVTAGAIWFAFGLAPSSVLGLLAAVGQQMAEHRVYVGAGGFFLALVWLGTALARRVRDRWPASNAWLASATAIVVAGLMTLTLARNRVWANPILLWEEATIAAPATFAAHLGLARALRNAGVCQLAELSFVRAMALRPDQPEPYMGLIQCFNQRPRPEDPGAEASRLCGEALMLEEESPVTRQCVRRLERMLTPAAR